MQAAATHATALLSPISPKGTTTIPQTAHSADVPAPPVEPLPLRSIHTIRFAPPSESPIALADHAPPAA
jgi:hypothetical protein